jgi:hypothetical protein
MSFIITQGFGSPLLVTQGFGGSGGVVVPRPGCVHGDDFARFHLRADSMAATKLTGDDFALTTVSGDEVTC